MRLTTGWVTNYEYLVLSLWVILENDTVNYYSKLVIFGNSWSLIIIVFLIVICPKTKLQGVWNAKKLNLKSIINFIHLMILGICFF